MARKTLTKPKEDMAQGQLDTECIHHWLIEPPLGPISKGYCKICGVKKEFKNFVRYSAWDSISSPLSGLGIDFAEVDVENEENQ